VASIAVLNALKDKQTKMTLNKIINLN